MALKDCVKKLGAAHNKQDLDAIQKLIDSGIPEVNAVKYHLKKLENAAQPDDVELVEHTNVTLGADGSVTLNPKGTSHDGFNGVTLIGNPSGGTQLTEFAGAAIPASAPQEVIDILNQHDIPYTTYPRDNKLLREKAINKFTDNILFQKAERNSMGLYSAVEQAVIDTKLPQWAKGGAAPGVEVWSKVSKTPSVKAEELQWMGLEDFLKAGESNKFTREQVLEFVANNGVDVVEVTADENGMDEDYEQPDFTWRESQDTSTEMYEDEGQRLADQYGTDEQDADTFKEALNAVIASHNTLLNDRFDGNVMADQIIDWTNDEIPDGLYIHQRGMTFSELKIAQPDSAQRASDNWKTFDMDKRRAIINEGSDQNPNGKFKPAVVEYVKQHYADELKQKYSDLAFDQAYNDYMEDPFTVFTDSGVNITIEGNSSHGYRILDRNGNVHAEDIQGFNEAEIQARELIAPPEGSGNQKAKYGQYIMDGDHRNYRELKLTLPNLGGEDFKKGSHFDEPNIVAFLRVDDRDLMVDGQTKNTYFIDEFQSDWHQAGRKQGYKIGTDLKAIDEKMTQLNKEVSKETNDLWHNLLNYTTAFLPVVDDKGVIVQRDLHNDEQHLIKMEGWDKNEVVTPMEFRNRVYTLLSDPAKMEDVKSTYGVDSSTYKSYQFAKDALDTAAAKGDINIADLQEKLKEVDHLEQIADTEREGVPNAPFKGDAWLNLGLKRAIVDAVNNGYDAIAWPNAQVMSDRYSSRYSTLYENQYDTKMPSAVKKLTGIAPKLMGLDGSNIDTTFNAEGYHIIPLTKELKAKVKENSFPLFQDKGMEYKRGAIQLLADNKRIIHLGEQSDPSTLIHELAHFYLELEKQLASEFGINKNQKRLLEWLNIESFDDIKTAHHEKYAETYETYLERGVAPSPFLRESFANFRRWINSVYRILKGRPNAHLSPEIIEYFDRSLASEEEIEMMQANPVFDQFFRSKEQSGMTDAEWDKYKKQAKRVADTAETTVDQKLIAELKKRKSDEWKEEKDPLIDEEKNRLSKLPVYAAMRDAATHPMDYDAVIEAMGGAKLPGKLIGRAKKGGINPMDYAEAYGFPSVRGMIDAIVSSPALGQAADDAAQKRMIAKYGDILNDGSLEREARNAMHNTEHAEMLLMELKALDKKTPFDRAYLESEAQLMIGKMKYSEIKPDRYFKGEIRAAKKAVAAKTDAEKYEAKAQQIANHYLYRRALEVKDQMESQRKYVRGVQTRTYNTKEVDPAHVQNMKVLAKSYEMRKDDPQRARNYEAILDWMTTQMKDENHYVQLDVVDVNLAKALIDREQGKSVSYEFPAFDDMTSEELTSLYDQLKHLRFVGGKMSENSKADLMISRANSAESISRNAKKIIPAQHERSALASVTDTIVKFGFSHMRIRSIFNTLDGYEKGPMDKEYDLITAAFNKELALTDQMAKSMDAAFKPVFKVINRRNQTTITKRDGQDWTLSHRARFVLGLNWGNEGNRVALLEGLNNKFHDAYTEADVTQMLSKMSNPELQALNDVWSSKEALWPELSGAQVRIKGVAPPKIQATPFTINGIRLTGGHYRLHYVVDPADSGRKDISIEDNQRDSILMKTASSLNERVGSGGRQVDLELSHLFRDVGEDIHYIAFAEQAEHLNAMFKGAKNPVVAAITKGYGQPYYDNLVSTMDGFIHPAEPTTGMWKFMRYVRSNLTYAYLAGSIRNIIQQPVAITNTFSQLGTGNTLAGALDFYTNPVKNWDDIRQKSVFMRNRTELVNREATEQLSKIDSIHPVWGAIKKGAFMPQTFMDSLIAFPTWMGALRKFQLDNPTATEAEGIKYADEMVVNTVGSGLSRDIGHILSGSEAEKQITFMGTFFNLTTNLHIENYQLYKRGKISGFEYARRLGWMAIVPAILTAWILDDLPEDDDANMLLYLLKKVAFYNFSSVFMVRDLVSSFDGFTPTIPGLQFGTGIVAISKDAKKLITGDEEVDMKTIASMIRGVEPLAPLPGAGQVARTLEGAADPNQGTWGMLVEGKERN